MKANVKWVAGDTFLGLSQSGHNVVFDTSKEGGAPSPLEMVLMSAGACSSVDVVGILEKARQNVHNVEVELSAERADSVPRLFTKMHLNFVITGEDVSEKHVARAVSLSAEKYCSVALMLEKSVEITHSFEIRAASEK